MTAKERFESAKEIYASYGVDVESAIKKCMGSLAADFKSCDHHYIAMDTFPMETYMGIFMGILQGAFQFWI